jgi:hypothetical protein
VDKWISSNSGTVVFGALFFVFACIFAAYSNMRWSTRKIIDGEVSRRTLLSKSEIHGLGQKALDNSGRVLASLQSVTIRIRNSGRHTITIADYADSKGIVIGFYSGKIVDCRLTERSRTDLGFGESQLFIQNNAVTAGLSVFHPGDWFVLEVVGSELDPRPRVSATGTDRAPKIRYTEMAAPSGPKPVPGSAPPTFVSPETDRAVATQGAAADAVKMTDFEVRRSVPGPPLVVRLSDVEPHPFDPEAIAARWRGVPRSTRIPIGASAVGPVTIDLLESGPHMFASGMTGCGKSILLQATILGLAEANRPDQLQFVLFDFNGGASLGEFRSLPHCERVVTDLDGPAAVRRALIQIEAELRRRKLLLSQAGAGENLATYHKMVDDGTLPASCPPLMPRLVVVVDQFDQLMTFLGDISVGPLEVIGVVGRSLGLHLILASQGTYLPRNIRENVGLWATMGLEGGAATQRPTIAPS